MRRAREQPRLAIAKGLGAVGLVLAGVVLGVAVKSGDGDRVRATEVRVVSAQRSANARASELRIAIAHTERIARDVRDANGRAQTLAESNRRLRRELRTARRARRQARRQP
jgi:hypothetical protein